jgi:hypothetical protein
MKKPDSDSGPPEPEARSDLQAVLQKSRAGKLNLESTTGEFFGWRTSATDVQAQYDKLVDEHEKLSNRLADAPENALEDFIAVSKTIDTLKSARIPANDEARKKHGRDIAAALLEIGRIDTIVTDAIAAVEREVASAAQAKLDLEQGRKDKLLVDKYRDLAPQLEALDIGSAPIGKEIVNLRNFMAWSKGYEGTRPVTPKQRIQLDRMDKVEEAFREASAAAEMQRRLDALLARLNALLPEKATPADLAPNATQTDLDPLAVQRGKIVPLLDSAESVDKAEKMIADFAGKIASRRAQLAALVRERDALQDDVDQLIDPVGCKLATEQAIALQRTEIAAWLGKPATRANIDEAKRAIAKLSGLIDQGNEETKEQRKAYGKRIEPTSRAFNRLKNTFERLGVPDQLAAFDGEFQAIKTAQKAGDWAGAADKAEILLPKLAPAEKLATDLSDFRGGTVGKLLQGTYDKIVQTMPRGFTVAALKIRLEQVYTQQCEVTRQNWIEFLGIAGANVKSGPDRAHYTTFNDAVMKADATLDVRLATPVLCRRLFESVNSTAQIHATVTWNGTRYHMYWDGTESFAVARDNLRIDNSNLWNEMNTIWLRMHADMEAKIDEARLAHGRIGNARMGPAV